jgi:Potential Queuosine, Q, salvage protein family
MDELRAACAAVAARASHVTIVAEAIATVYRTDRPAAEPPQPAEAALPEELTARWLTLDAINFGSGWFPTLRKRPGLSGYGTIAAGLSERFTSAGPWTAAELSQIDAAALAPILGQDPQHELMALYAASLRDLGQRVADEHHGRFTGVTDAAHGSAVTLASRLGDWSCFDDTSRYGDLQLPFLKRAQLAAADLHRAGAAQFRDIARLTMFADNLVPHVLRLDGVLRFSPELVARIEREDLIEHGSPEEVEIRAGAVHAVELLVKAGVGVNASELDQALWQRGQQPHYKASPRHRTRCTAY